MSQPSPDAKAVVRAAEALTTQVRRIADALSTTAVRYEVAADDTPTTPVHCPLCPIVVPLATAQQATDHFQVRHPEQRLVGPGPWPQLATDDGPTTPGDGARCVCGDPIEWWTGPGDSAGWIHRPSIGSAPLTVHQARPAPAADEDAQRTTRRASLLNLLARLQRGGMTAEEKVALRQHAEAEIREADTARAVAAGNKRHVQVMYGELTAAQAAIERVRHLVTGAAQTTAAGISDHAIGRYDLAVEVVAALDGTEQPTTEPGFTDQHANPDIIGTTEGP